jgi:3'-5' exoribonuclease
MKENFVADLKKAGTTLRTTFLVQSKEQKTTSAGAPYLDVNLQDSTGVIGAKLWDSDRHALDFDVDDLVLVEGQVESYRGTLQIRIRKISRCADETIDLADYLPRSEQDPEPMYAAVLDRLRAMPEGPLRTLLLAVTEDPAVAEKYKQAPAALSFHHARRGGLLEHVVSLIALADKVCDHYTSLRRDLVLAGIILHDLGKIEEFNFLRSVRYSTRGQLLGHIGIALEIVGEKVRTIPDFPADLKDRVGHIILSHHGKLEFGSPKEPMFPEALVVHYLDDLDSKLEAMRGQYAADKDRAGDWTAWNPALRRELLKTPAEAEAGPTETPPPASPNEHGGKNPSR